MRKYAILLLTILYALASQSRASETSQNPNTTDSVVMFTFGGVPVDMDSMAVRLAEALESHPEARQFRTNWTYSVGGGSGDGDVLYDRKLKILKYFERDYDSQGISTFRYTFDNVTDPVLYKLRADLISPSERRKVLANAKFVFEGLLKYGCHRTGGWKYRKWGVRPSAKKKQHK